MPQEFLRTKKNRVAYFADPALYSALRFRYPYIKDGTAGTENRPVFPVHGMIRAGRGRL